MNLYLTANKNKEMESSSVTRCGYCRSLGAKRRCSQCKAEFYCNRECQKLHWKIHKIGCHHSKQVDKPAMKMNFSSQECISVKESDRKPSPKEFDISGKLGEGNFSTVGLATHRPTGETFAVKVMEKQKIKRMRYRHKNIDNEIMMEREVLYNLQHPNIVKLYHTFQDAGNLYFLMERLEGGELWERITKNGELVGMYESAARWYTAQVINGLEYIHSNGIVHRDIKPENIILTKDGRCRIVDFGTAKNLNNAKLNGPEFVGTPEYMAPEVVNSENAQCEADLWSLGSVIYQLITGVPPFKAGSPYLSFKKALAKDFTFPPSFPSVAADLVNQLFSIDPKDRLGSQTRGGYDALKKHPWFEGIDFNSLEDSIEPNLTDIEKDATEICEMYLFKGKDYKSAIHSLPPPLRDAVTLYTIRHKKYHIPSIYSQFHHSQLDARFQRVWCQSVLGMSQNDAGTWTDPFWFTAVGQPIEFDNSTNNVTESSATALTKIADRMNTLKPKFMIMIGDMLSPAFSKSSNGDQINDPMNDMRSYFLNMRDNIPLLIIPGPNDVGEIGVADHNFEKQFGTCSHGYTFWIQGCCFVAINSIFFTIESSDANDHMEWLRKIMYTAKLCACHVVVFSYYPLVSVSGDKSLESPILPAFREELLQLCHDATVKQFYYFGEKNYTLVVKKKGETNDSDDDEEDENTYRGISMIGIGKLTSDVHIASLYRYKMEHDTYDINDMPNEVVLRLEEET